MHSSIGTPVYMSPQVGKGGGRECRLGGGGVGRTLIAAPPGHWRDLVACREGAQTTPAQHVVGDAHNVWHGEFSWGGVHGSGHLALRSRPRASICTASTCTQSKCCMPNTGADRRAAIPPVLPVMLAPCSCWRRATARRVTTAPRRTCGRRAWCCMSCCSAASPLTMTPPRWVNPGPAASMLCRIPAGACMSCAGLAWGLAAGGGLYLRRGHACTVDITHTCTHQATVSC
jgi:hypothetical protein